MLTQLTGAQVCLGLSKVRFKSISRERGSRILQHGQEICYSPEGDIARVEWYRPSKKLSLCYIFLVTLSPWYTAGASNVRSHVSTARQICPGEEG